MCSDTLVEEGAELASNPLIHRLEVRMDSPLDHRNITYDIDRCILKPSQAFIYV